MSPEHVTLYAWLLWLIAIAAMDLRVRRVRNWMVLLGLGAGIFALLTHSQPLQITWQDGLTGMCAAFAALLPFYALRWMGAGDVKFAAVIGLWFGLSSSLLAIWIGGSLLAGVHGVIVLLWRQLRNSPFTHWILPRLPSPMMATFAAQPLDVAPAQGSAHQIQRTIPYAGYMAIAAIWILATSNHMPAT